jgi:hypothetical protein
MTTMKNLKMKEEKRSEIEYVRNRVKEQVQDVELSFKEAKTILDKVNEITDFLYVKELDEDVTIKFDAWGRYVKISDVNDTKLFNSFVIALTELYNDGEKTMWENDGVKYSFIKKEKFMRNIYITLSVKNTVTGCIITREMVTVPEKVIPEHIEEKVILRCEA